MKKERIDNFEFIRSVTAWIIVIYHFAGICVSTPQYANFPFLYTHANGVWGENTSVNIFFMLSGASLFYNHSKLDFKSLKKYYFDRFKGIFPMFYILWFLLYYDKVVSKGTIFYNGSPKSMILTLFGMDGYLNYRYPRNYYFIGEWFLGALVCIYLLYPLLAWCMKHCKIFVTVVLTGLTFAMMWLQPYFLIQKERNLIVCMWAFWLGMLFIEHRNQLTKMWITLLFGALALLFIFVKVPIDPFICAQFISIGLFLIFYQIGGCLMRFAAAKTFFTYTARISYAIFLLQHVVMGQILGIFSEFELTILQEVGILAVTFIVIYLFATMLTTLNKAVVAKLNQICYRT